MTSSTVADRTALTYAGRRDGDHDDPMPGSERALFIESAHGVGYGRPMVRRVTGWDGVRALRLAVFSVAATCLALGSHLLAGGALPALVPTLLACLLPAAAGVVLTRRRRGSLDILVVLGLVQLAMHEVFVAGDPHPGTAGSGAAMPADCLMGPLGFAGQTAMGASGAALVMVGVHLAATIITAGLLARGEQALHVLMPLVDWMRRGTRVSVAPARSVPVLMRSVRQVTVPPSVPRLGLVAIAAVARRGPPTPVW